MAWGPKTEEAEPWAPRVSRNLCAPGQRVAHDGELGRGAEQLRGVGVALLREQRERKAWRRSELEHRAQEREPARRRSLVLGKAEGDHAAPPLRSRESTWALRSWSWARSSFKVSRRKSAR